MIIDELGVDKLICPICGNPKYLRTICSGNTFGGRIWSDSRHEYPMMLSHSTIQICNHCGHYFHIDNAKCDIEVLYECYDKIEWLDFDELK